MRILIGVGQELAAECCARPALNAKLVEDVDEPLVEAFVGTDALGEGDVDNLVHAIAYHDDARLLRLADAAPHEGCQLVDVDAGRILASAGYARLHTNEEFLADIAAARAEYVRLAGGNTQVNAPKAVMTTRSAAIYNMAGEQLNNEPSTGAYIQNGKKYIKKAD